MADGGFAPIWSRVRGSGLDTGSGCCFIQHRIASFGKLVALLGAVLASPTLMNWVLWLSECGLQFARARAEEQFLSSDPVYRAYRQRVRYRLIPGLI